MSTLIKTLTRFTTLNGTKVPFWVTCKAYYSLPAPIFEFYQTITGEEIPERTVPTLKKKHPNIAKLSNDDIQCIVQILNKFGITPFEACKNMHVFSMNPITLDNYGEIFRECGFITITASHIIKYHTTMKRKSVSSLKNEGLMPEEFEVEQSLLDKFKDWPAKSKVTIGFPESSTPLITIRTSVLERYLKWRLSISSEDFVKYCRNYLPLRHKPMADIQESLDLAQNEIKFNDDTIRRNGFLISQDPLNTKLIIDNVNTIAGIDIRDVIKVEPAILKNNYVALLKIRDILEEYRIPNEFQRKCLKIYCMKSETVKSRLEELRGFKEYSILSSNPRMLALVIHKNKFENRLEKIQAAKKQCYSFNHLVSARKVFNNYISSFGSKTCGRDITILILSSLNITPRNGQNVKQKLLKELKKHKYWLHTSINCIDDNIRYLKEHFDNDVIFNNCHILLYPLFEIKHYLDILLESRAQNQSDSHLDITYNNVRNDQFTDDQILSLTLYEIEKKYHFTGDGIWARQETNTTDALSS